MAHYAFLNEQNIVTHVIPGKDETDGDLDWERYYGEITEQVCKRTSYNTYGNVHLGGGTPYRKNYAGPGFLYDEARDAFIPPKEFASWTLNEETCRWESPVPYPTDGKYYRWNESNQSWDES